MKHFTYTFIAAAALTGGYYMNQNTPDKALREPASIPSAHVEAKRLPHARELLGDSFKQSQANKKMPKSFNWNKSVEAYVKRNLPTAYKKQSKAIAQAILKESTKQGLDPVFVLAVIKTESSFNPLAIGSVGEIGLMQIRPETAEWITKKYKIAWSGSQNLKDPVKNIRVGIQYLSWLRGNFRGSASKYLPAYNMGPTKVRRMVAQAMQPREYPVKVMRNYQDTYVVLANN